MEENYKSGYLTHVIILLVVLITLGVGGFYARKAFLPEGFGKYGHYRAGAIEDEMNLPLRNMTNESCLDCHPFIKKIHLKGVHKTVSCEMCHSAYANHVDKNGKVYAKMPKKQGKEIKELCLRCHNKAIKARPVTVIKVVEFPGHLEEKKVRTDHNCDQCHHVHAPLYYVNLAKEMMNMKEEKK